MCPRPARRPLVRVGTWFDCCRVASDCRVCNDNNGNADVLNKQPDRRKAPPGRRITPCRAPAAPQALDRANANSQTIRTLRSGRTGRCLRALLRARAPTPLHSASPQPLLGLISAGLHLRSAGTQQPRLGSGQPRRRHRPGGSRGHVGHEPVQLGLAHPGALPHQLLHRGWSGCAGVGWEGAGLPREPLPVMCLSPLLCITLPRPAVCCSGGSTWPCAARGPCLATGT